MSIIKKKKKLFGTNCTGNLRKIDTIFFVIYCDMNKNEISIVIIIY